LALWRWTLWRECSLNRRLEKLSSGERNGRYYVGGMFSYVVEYSPPTGIPAALVNNVIDGGENSAATK